MAMRYDGMAGGNMDRLRRRPVGGDRGTTGGMDPAGRRMPPGRSPNPRGTYRPGGNMPPPGAPRTPDTGTKVREPRRGRGRRSAGQAGEALQRRMPAYQRGINRAKKQRGRPTGNADQTTDANRG